MCIGKRHEQEERRCLAGQGSRARSVNSCRLFCCRRCRRQVRVCRRCDRGNAYCGTGCRRLARREQTRRAGRTYQATLKGKLAHARRSKGYRERQKVTHQGSHRSTVPAGWVASETSLAKETHHGQENSSSKEVRCDFCGRVCPVFVRAGHLRRPRHTSRRGARLPIYR